MLKTVNRTIEITELLYCSWVIKSFLCHCSLFISDTVERQSEVTNIVKHGYACGKVERQKLWQRNASKKTTLRTICSLVFISAKYPSFRGYCVSCVAKFQMKPGSPIYWKTRG